MVCKKCGVEITEETKVCPLCGAELDEVAEETVVVEEAMEEVKEVFEEGVQAEELAEDEALKPIEQEEIVEEECGCGCCGEDGGKCRTASKIAITIVALVIVVAAAVACFMTGLLQSPAQKAHKKYYDALVAGDGEAVYKLDIDPYEVENVVAGIGVANEQEVIKMYVDTFKQYPDMFKQSIGDNAKAHIYVAEIHKYTKEEKAKLAQHLTEICAYPEGALQDLVVLDCLVTIKGSTSTQRSYMEEVVAKIDGKWYVGSIGDIYNPEVVKQILNGEYQPQAQLAPQEEVPQEEAPAEEVPAE